jgi:hypothetical protein
MVKKIAAIALCMGALLPIAAQVEPNAGSWKTWVLTNGRELRLQRPPQREETVAELAWLKTYMARHPPVRRSDKADACLDGRPARLSVGGSHAEPDRDAWVLQPKERKELCAVERRDV